MKTTGKGRQIEADSDILFRALANTSRRQILERLRKRNGLALVEICSGMKMTRAGVINHIALLMEARLVVAIRKGRRKLHYLNAAPLHEIAERWIRPFEKK